MSLLMDHLPASQRPRERLARLGMDVLSDVELLALVLGTSNLKREDVLSLAGRLLSHFGSLRDLGRANIRELQRLRGVGVAKASRLLAAVELGRRAMADRSPQGRVQTGPADVADWFRRELGVLEHEVFWVLGLDVRNRVIQAHRVAEGHSTGVEVHPREVFRSLVRMGAVSTILVHNHPSGNVSPSPQDMELTKRLVAAGALVGIRVLDHLVVGGFGFFSLADHGLLDVPGS